MAERDQLPEDEPEGSTVDSFLREVARAPRVSVLPIPGQLVGGKYRIERLLGAGAMGAVFAARHDLLQQTIALKVMLPETAASGQAAARFLNEARAAARIEGDHVARVLDVGHLENGAPFIALELLEGADLSQVLAERGCLSQSDALLYVVQALEAVAQAHALHIVHRDLKPANLFLARRRDGTQLVKVLDFGISKALNLQTATSPNALTQSSSMLGSPLYMSPEQVRSSKDVDPRADIWAIGVILFELLAGKPPFDAKTVNHVLVQILEQEPLRLRAFRPDLPEQLERVVLRCLAKDPAQRFANVAELALALAPFAPPEVRPLIERIERIITGRPPSLAAEQVSALAATDPVLGPVPARSNPRQSVNSVRVASWVGASTVGLALVAVGVTHEVSRHQPPLDPPVPSASIPSAVPTSKTLPAGPDAGLPTPSASSAVLPAASVPTVRWHPPRPPAPALDPFGTPK